MNFAFSRSKSTWSLLLLLLNLILISWIMHRFINLTYPLIGHDYNLAIPSMLDTLIHFRNQGLTIQWYTPSFGGGVPVFPNPNNGEYSILEILPLWMNPWRAVFVSTVIFISLGFFASYRLFSHVLKFSIQTSILGAIFFSLNGFMLERIAVGHLGYQPFPLIAVILLLFFDTTFSPLIAGVLLGLLVALLLHQAGYFLIVVFGLSGLIVVSLIGLIQPKVFSARRFLIILSLGALLGAVISASKLTAVYSFMRYFPRLSADTYNVSTFSGVFGIIMQLLGTTNLTPLLIIAKLNTSLLPLFMVFTTGANYGYWEFDMSLSPVVFGLILAGLARIAHARQKAYLFFFSGQKWIATLLFIISTWITVEFTLASGWIYTSLRHLPILSSMHVNARFAAAFIFPLALIAAKIYNSISLEWGQKKSWIVFAILNILTLVPFAAYFQIKDDLQARVYDISQSLTIYNSIKSGKVFKVTSIGTTSNNTQALRDGISNLNLYDPIFGYTLENFHPEIEAGPIQKQTDGYFNMTNPSGYVFPHENNTRPFERIKLDDQANLVKFTYYGQPDWKIPLYQHISNWASILAFVTSLVFLGVYLLIFVSQRSSRQPAKTAPQLGQEGQFEHD